MKILESLREAIRQNPMAATTLSLWLGHTAETKGWVVPLVKALFF